ncbi:MAG: hypothetical protein WA962_02290 [Ornithinimicrobium sp.]
MGRHTDDVMGPVSSRSSPTVISIVAILALVLIGFAVRGIFGTDPDSAEAEMQSPGSQSSMTSLQAEPQTGADADGDARGAAPDGTGPVALGAWPVDHAAPQARASKLAQADILTRLAEQARAGSATVATIEELIALGDAVNDRGAAHLQMMNAHDRDDPQ